MVSLEVTKHRSEAFPSGPFIMFNNQIPGGLKISLLIGYLGQLSTYHIERTILRTMGTVSNQRSAKGPKTSFDHLTPFSDTSVNLQEFVLKHVCQYNINDPSSPHSRSPVKYLLFLK